MKTSVLRMEKQIESLNTKVESSTVVAPQKLPFAVHALRIGFRVLGRIFPKYAGNLAFRLFRTPQRRARHKVSDRILEEAKLFEIIYGGKILKGYAWGSGERTCLLVHGWESRGTALRSFVPDLVANGYRVVTFDAPAHGNSDGTQTDLSQFSGSIRAIIHHIGAVDTIIAHSFGGASTVFAMANIDNTIAVRKLVMIATPSRLDRALNHFSDFLKLPSKVRFYVKKALEAKVKIPIDEVNVFQAYSKINVGQTMIVHDELDDVVPFTSAESIYKHWDNVLLLVTKGLGHFRLMKNPDLIKRVIRFLQE